MSQSERTHVLVVDQNESRGEVIQRCLSEEFDISLARTPEAARAILDAEEIDLLMSTGESPRKDVTDAVSNLARDILVKHIVESGSSLQSAIAELESAIILTVLKQQQGNRSATARKLQMPRQTLQDRMRKLGLWSS